MSITSAAAASASSTRFCGLGGFNFSLISCNSFLSLSSSSSSSSSSPSFTLPTLTHSHSHSHKHKHQSHHYHCCAIRTTGSQDSYSGSDFLRKPIVSSPEPLHHSQTQLVNWEDKILEATVPLVGFVRMILHSNRYQSGDRLSPDHQTTILDRLLPYHPDYYNKVGCGVDYITIGYHPQFEESRCLFIVRKDGELVDFSYWKCIKGFIRKNYPLYADTFILKHFRRRRRD